MWLSTSGNDTSPFPAATAHPLPPASASEYTHSCGHVSPWGRCELHDPIDTLPSLWGVAEVVPATSNTREHLHPFQFCEAEQAAVNIWAHHSSTVRTRTAVVVIHRDRHGQRWEATL